MSTSPFPSAHSYLRQLPAGLDSFGHCLASSRLPRAMLREFPHLLRHEQLPDAWKRVFVALLDSSDSSWLPEVHNILLNHVVCDAFFPSEESFLERNKQRIIASFSSPLMRGLMRLTTPHLLVMGASHRWGTYHRGSELKIDKHDQGACRGRLRYPPTLFSPLMLKDTRVALEASIELTRHRVHHISIDEKAQGEAPFELQWATASASVRH